MQKAISIRSVVVFIVVLCAALSLSLFSAVGHASAASNLVANGDFETAAAGNPAMPASWTTDEWGTHKATFTYPVAGDASAAAAKVQMTSYTSGDAKWYMARVPVTPGTVYTVSDNYMSNVATEVDVEYLSTAGKYTYGYIASPASSNNTWATFTGQFTPPAGTASIAIIHVINKVGVLTIDNMAVCAGSCTPPAPPVINAFTANPTLVQSGQSSTLSWNVTGATSLSIDQGVGTVTGTSKVVTPSATTTYTLTATNGAGSVTATVTVNWQPAPILPPVINSFTANPTLVQAGQSSTLSWSLSGSPASLSIDQGIGAVSGTSKVVTPSATTTYTLTATNSAGTATAQATVNWQPAPPPPPTCSLTANPTQINAGSGTTLNFSSTNANSASIDNGVGNIPTSGSVAVAPSSTVTYTGTFIGAGGTVTCTATVTVIQPPVINSFAANPTLVQAGQSSTLSWSLSGSPATLSIDQGVGTVTGTSKVVTPSATTTYTLTATNSAGSVTAQVTVNFQPAPTQLPNLIVNGNFEQGTTNNPTNWTADYWGSNTRTFTYPVTGNGGGKAAKIQITRFSSGAAEWVFPHITSNSHTIYQYDEDYQSNVATEIDTEVLMSDGSYQYEWVQTIQPSTNWSHISAQITLPPGAVSFTVLHILAKVGTLTIDNASLTVPPANQFANGMVTFAFDDGLLSQSTNAAPILTNAGMSGSFYIITTEPTSGDTSYMTWAQIKALSNQGFEIGGHTRTHPYLTTLTASQLTNEVSGSYSDLVAQGYSPKTFVYPFGDVDAAVEAATKAAGYIGARGSYFGDNVPFTDRYDLYDMRLDPTVSLATAEAEVDQAKADHRWLVFEIHDVIPTGGDGYQITPAFFQSLVNYIKASGIQVVTMQQGMTQMNP